MSLSLAHSSSYSYSALCEGKYLLMISFDHTIYLVRVLIVIVLFQIQGSTMDVGLLQIPKIVVLILPQ
jgi:hypothetical protein